VKRAFASVPVRARDIPMETRVRFINKIEVASNSECWEWTGAKSDQGYGSFRLNGTSTTAQRVAYALFVGDLDEAGVTVDHLCNNPGCMNPRHLQAVPHRVNVLRSNGVCAEYARRTHCPTCGDPYSLYDGPNHKQRYCAQCKRNNAREWARRKRNSDPAKYRV
jgi:hypothetical protein